MVYSRDPATLYTQNTKITKQLQEVIIGLGEQVGLTVFRFADLKGWIFRGVGAVMLKALSQKVHGLVWGTES